MLSKNPKPEYSDCKLCPRKCGADRSLKNGFCGMGDKIVCAKACLHKWEEPCISYKNGAGTVFFSGCSLRCCYCQNSKISLEMYGREVSPDRLADIFLSLQEKGADNIELVTPTHFLPDIIKALDRVKSRLSVPIVYNTGGYELPETVRMLRDYVDIWIPDIKYFSPEIAEKYSKAPDYFKYASETVLTMTEQAGELLFNDNGGLLRGTIIRHLVLPSCRHDSMKILDWIAENIPPEKALVSIMNQYTPTETLPEKFPELQRRVTKMEYNSVVRHAQSLGLNGYTQEKSSASPEYIPDFDLSGL